MSYQLVIERPKHDPRFLGSFRSREDAEAELEQVLSDHPSWVKFVRIVRTKPREESSQHS